MYCLKHITIALFLLVLPVTGSFAAAGCCSHHGGVNGCDKATNHDMCKDGTASPTCACDGSKTSATPAASKATTTKSSTTTTATPTATKTTKTVEKSATTVEKPTTTSAVATTTTKISTKGCCAKHGGVDKCNKKTGFQVCKDGTPSTTCKC